MGSGSSSSISSERLDRASASGILTLSNAGISSWSKLIKHLHKVRQVQQLTLSDNKLRKAMPTSFVQIDLFAASLTSLDLSNNGMRSADALGMADVPRFSETAGASTTSTSSSAFAVGPLEVLNLSRNDLSNLPPLLLLRFPRLKRLICTGNVRPLAFKDDTFMSQVGHSTVLESIELSNCGVTSFALLCPASLDAAPGKLMSTKVFPSLEQVLLDGNPLTGTFILARNMTTTVIFTKLKRISLTNLKDGRLEAVDAQVYASCPSLVTVDVSGNANEDALLEKLRGTSPYEEWRDKHASIANSNAAAGGAVLLA